MTATSERPSIDEAIREATEALCASAALDAGESAETAEAMRAMQKRGDEIHTRFVEVCTPEARDSALFSGGGVFFLMDCETAVEDKLACVYFPVAPRIRPDVIQNALGAAVVAYDAGFVGAVVDLNVVGRDGVGDEFACKGCGAKFAPEFLVATAFFFPQGTGTAGRTTVVSGDGKHHADVKTKLAGHRYLTECLDHVFTYDPTSRSLDHSGESGDGEKT